jgi:hypothetical protein
MRSAERALHALTGSMAMTASSTAHRASAPTLPTIIDVEASGFGAGSYPIEVGFVLPDGKAFCTLIRPEPDWTRWDCSSEQVHRIPRHILGERGRTVQDVASTLNSVLGGRRVYSDAWGNDSSWLALLFEHAGVRQSFRLESLRAVIDERQAALWHPVKDDIMREFDLCRHRASSDALILQRTWERTRQLVLAEEVTA